MTARRPCRDALGRRTRRVLLACLCMAAATCKPEGGVNVDGPGAGGPDCGERPELPYTCAEGEPTCTCTAEEGGGGHWVCDPCDDAEVDCGAFPEAPVCRQDGSCIGCHGLKTSADGVGIENAHAWSYVGCTVCHGGRGVDDSDPGRQLTQAESHVPMPAEMAEPGSNTPRRTSYENNYLGRAGVEEMEGGLEWIRFMNPGDLRIVDDTCAQSGCHEGAGDKVRRSTMSTLVGKYDAMLYMAGLGRAPELLPGLGTESYDKRLATYAALHVEDPEFDAATAPPGAVRELVALQTPDRETERPFGTYTEDDVMRETINKLCGDCHLNNHGSNSFYGNFRSSGCSACHMPYDYSGRSTSSDPLIPKDEPTYPDAYSAIRYPERPHTRTHQLTRVPSSNDCLPCHTGSNRTVWQYMGIRTDDNRDLTRAREHGADIDFRTSTLVDNQLNPDARLRGFSEDQLIEFEDLDHDGQDDTPADVHYRAGLQCIDCHNATDFHGDGRIYSRQDQATTVRCEHCHGNLEYPVDPDLASNPINELYEATGNLDRKYLWIFDSIPGFDQIGFPAVTQPGVWLRTKSRGEWRYVTQIAWGVQYDPESGACIENGRRTDPRSNTFVCSEASSVAHGRWQGLNAGRGDLTDGVGPRPDTEVVLGADGDSSNVRIGFSHLGEPTSGPNERSVGGVQCTSCHAPWHAMRFGNHLGLVDTDGTDRFYDWDRVSGQWTLGRRGWFDFTYVSNLDLQLGVHANGKIAYFIPTRLKMFVRASVLDPSDNEPFEFMTGVGDPEHPWKTYRDRVGYGNLISGAAAGVTDAPGFGQICIEPFGFCDEDPRKNVNGSLGVDQMEPHTVQREARQCTSCHLDETASNRELVSTVYGWNPNGFTPQTSAYLAAISQVVTNHGTYSTSDGYVISDDGIRHRLDWLVDEETGYPLASTMHVRTDGGEGYETYDRDAAGPITLPLIRLLGRVRVSDQGE